MAGKNRENSQEVDKKIDEKITPRAIEEELKDSYLTYAMSVIVSRALPDIRDGLKPVQRRILFTMHEMGVHHNRPFKKSARVTGETMGRFHPHGDASIYAALVRMAQNFSLRYPLVIGQGNFGCFTKDTKVALTDGRELSFEDLIKENIEGKKNYTYTINKLGNVAVAEIKNPRLTKKSAEIMKVILDNNKEIKCTLNHKFMLRDGTYKEAQNLKVEDSLMPLYTRLSEKTKLKVAYAKFNHKVKEVVFLKEYEDVYDLTIENTHNFSLAAGIFVHNSIDGDEPAAQRYTEVKLAKISDEVLQDIEKETVLFVPNYSNEFVEPTYLPSKLPNLLLNGSSGIAVGMATNIPPHNVSEVCDGIIKTIQNPQIEIDELIGVIKGPDFPTGGIILGREGIRAAYKLGRGKIKVRAKARILENTIIVEEIPYQANKALIIEEIADLVRKEKIKDIRAIRDESSRDEIRIVVECRAAPEIVLNNLYKHTGLQSTQGIIMLALDKNRPKLFNLKEIITSYIEHRVEIITNRTRYDLRKAEERKHILEGFLIALSSIDEVVKVIKSSKNRDEAKIKLVSGFGLTDLQADAILNMRLSQLTNLEQEQIIEEDRQLSIKISEYKILLSSRENILAEIKREVLELKENYKDERRTQLSDDPSEILDEQLMDDTRNLLSITNNNYLKLIDILEFKVQGRGGKGVVATKLREEDQIKFILPVNYLDKVLLFTRSGKVYRIKAYRIPRKERHTFGEPVASIIGVQEDIVGVIAQNEFKEGDIIFATKNGRTKRCSIKLFERIQTTGKKAILLEQGDDLVDVKYVRKEDTNILIVTAKGKAVHFPKSDLRAMGRGAKGVGGIKVAKEDRVVSLCSSSDKKQKLFLISERGYGKRTVISQIRETRRRGKGVRVFKVSPKTGDVVRGFVVESGEEVFAITKQGQIIRTEASEISEQGRYSHGVRVIKLDEGDTQKSGISGNIHSADVVVNAIPEHKNIGEGILERKEIIKKEEEIEESGISEEELIGKQEGEEENNHNGEKEEDDEGTIF